MNRWFRGIFVIAALLISSIPALAMPEFLEMFRRDPFRRPEIDGCNTCHMSPEGGDARNPFGQAFEMGGEVITPMLRAQFPDRFVYPTFKASDTLTVHFSDPANKQIVMETGGMKTLADVENRTVDGKAAAVPGAATGGAAPQPVQRPTPRERPISRVDPFAHEGVFFGSNVVNLPNGKPEKRGGVDFFIGHRFTQDVKAAGLGGLYGFDSSAIVAYGVRVGLTDSISIAAMRSNLFKTISINSAIQVSRQNASVPLTLQVRVGVDGKQNFGLYRRSNNPAPRQYQPFIQVVATRTFNNFVSFVLAPTFAFNTRDEARVFPGFTFGDKYNNTTALGIGTGIRLLPSVSLVGEIIPRLYGFRGEQTDRPGVSIGLQKSTFRHTFELVVSRQQPMVTTQYAYQGVDTFRVGFNIYRRIR